MGPPCLIRRPQGCKRKHLPVWVHAGHIQEEVSEAQGGTEGGFWGHRACCGYPCASEHLSDMARCCDHKLEDSSGCVLDVQEAQGGICRWWNQQIPSLRIRRACVSTFHLLSCLKCGLSYSANGSAHTDHLEGDTETKPLSTTPNFLIG